MCVYVCVASLELSVLTKLFEQSCTIFSLADLNMFGRVERYMDGARVQVIERTFVGT